LGVERSEFEEAFEQTRRALGDAFEAISAEESHMGLEELLREVRASRPVASVVDEILGGAIGDRVAMA
jgi:hypothetical protein